jgi:hypothetical protein
MIATTAAPRSSPPTTVETHARRQVRAAVEPLAREERQLCEALASGDLRHKLIECRAARWRRSDRPAALGKVSRLLHGLHLYGLIAKVRKPVGRVTKKGLRVSTSALGLREYAFADLVEPADQQIPARATGVSSHTDSLPNRAARCNS